MRSGKKRNVRAARGDGLDRKRMAGGVAPASKLREKIGEAMDVRVGIAKIERRFFDVRVPQQEPGQLVSRVARYSDDGDPCRVVHRSISSTRF